MEFVNSFIDTYNIPLLTAFLLGILTSISPCPLATNITAIAFISKELKTVKNTLFNGIFYTVGRGVSYTLLATLIFFGFSSFSISSIFEGWGDKILGPVLIFIGLVMFEKINIKIGLKNEKIEKTKNWLSQKGYFGSTLLGALFALAFCPYSGVLFFGVLIPLVLNSKEGLLLPPFFAIGTGLPVIFFSFFIAIGMQKINRIFQATQKIEKIMRHLIASIFMLTGIYYLQYIIKFLLHL